MAAQDIGDRRGCRQAGDTVKLETVPDLAAAPHRLLTAQLADQSFHLRRCLTWRRQRPAAQLLHSVARQVLVAGLTANTVLGAQDTESKLSKSGLSHELSTLRHTGALPPGHRYLLPSRRQKCYPCLRTPVTYVPGLHKGEGARRGRNVPKFTKVPSAFRMTPISTIDL